MTGRLWAQLMEEGTRVEMKKYLIAAVAALAVFGASAFAASLDVDGSVVQAGTDYDLTCADGAVVDYVTQTVGSGQFAVTRVNVTFDPGCEGNFGYLALFSSADPGGSGSTQTGFGIQEIVGNQISFEVNESSPNAAVAMINAVSVAVKNTNDAAPAPGFHSGIITGP